MKHDRQVQIETDQLLALLKNPNLSKETLKRAHQLAFPEPDGGEWQGFLSGLFYSLGAALMLCGLFFFMELHWDRLDYIQRSTFFGLLTMVSAGLAWRWGKKSVSGKVALSCAAVFLGGFLLVFGRVAETDQWHHFLPLWSALILPWCIAAEFAPLWLFATLLFNVTLRVVCRHYLEPWFFERHFDDMAAFLLNGGLMTAWEIGFRQGKTWMGRRWFPPLLTIAALYPMTRSAGALLTQWNIGLNDLFPLVPVLWACWAGLLFYYSQVRRDVSVLSLTLSSGVYLGLCCLLHFVSRAKDPVSLLGLALGLTILISGALGFLRRLAPALPADPKAPPQETPDVRIWLGQLANEGLIRAQQIEDLELSMRVQDEASLPWLVRALTGLGAFVASVFLLLYLLSVGAITPQNGVLFGLGLCLLATFVAGVMRSSQLIAQTCLSLSLCGQLTVWLMHGGSPSTNALLMTVVEVALVLGYPSAFGRFLSTNLAGLFFARWLSLVAPAAALDLFVLAVAGAAVFLWFWQHDILSGSIGLAKVHAPISLGSVTLLLALLLSTITSAGGLPVVSPIVALGLTLLAVVSARRMGAPKRSLVGLFLVGLICWSAPGVIAAVLILLLGFYRRSQTLKGLAIVFLLAFGSAYYYHLAIGLMVKSLVMMASGIVLWLTARSVERSIDSNVVE